MNMVEFFSQNMHLFTLPIYLFILFCIVLSLLWLFGTDAFDNFDDKVDDELYMLYALSFCIAIADLILNSIWKLDQPINVILVILFFIIDIVSIGFFLKDFIMSANRYFLKKRGKL